MKAKPVSKPVGAEQKWFSVQLEDLARRTDVAKIPPGPADRDGCEPISLKRQMRGMPPQRAEDFKCLT
jgi:hypothetical protein